mgnify:CR=1 FL=1
MLQWHLGSIRPLSYYQRRLVLQCVLIVTYIRVVITPVIACLLVQPRSPLEPRLRHRTNLLPAPETACVAICLCG